MLEMLAIALAIGTFQGCLKGSLWSCFTDNDSVLGTMLSGGAGMSAQDLTNYIGRVWQDCASLDIGLMLYRVPSKSNIADGPTRYDLMTLEKFKAQFVPPVLPPWVEDVWQRVDFSGSDSCVPSLANGTV